MAQSFKARFWQTSRWFAGFFCLLFFFRLLYGYFSTNQVAPLAASEGSFINLNQSVRKNYASEKIIISDGAAAASQAQALNQKYEKTASVKTKTSEFDKDNKRIRDLTNSFRAIIQYEESRGNKGNRMMDLTIGVTPDTFDAFYLAIQQIGEIKEMEVTKVDKTNEYRQLNAKRASLEKNLQSLNELKSKGGAITDFVSLHDKILEVETQLQELGVELGNFDSENEFCTVKVSLYEGAELKGISFIHRVKVALEWTIQYYTILVFAFLGMLVCTFVLLLIIDKLKLMRTLSDKLNE